MAHSLDTKAFLDTVCELLRQGSTRVTVPVAGSSMVPFLHSGDTVYLDAVPEILCKGDVVLYMRPNGDYVLHRICKLGSDGSLSVAGDAQRQLEVLPDRSCVFAIAAAARHKDRLMTPKSFRWRFYRRVWLWLRPIRPLFLGLKRNKKK